MGELTSALDALAADDLKPMFGPQLLDRLGELLVLQNRVAAEVARTVRECELTQASEHDGLKTTQSWLRGHGRLSSGAASRLVHAGRALEHLPAVAAAFAAGEVTAEAVAVVAKAVRPDRLAAAAEQDIDLAPFDQAWAMVAAEQPHDRLIEVVQLYEAALDPDGPEPDPTESRRLTLARHAEGGCGRFDLDTVGFEKVQAALESIVQANRPKGDTRTRAQQNADALVQLCDNQLASGNLPFLRTVKPHVVLNLDVDDFADPATGAGA
ncbi:DUF222 domain-containing protein, partial [Modestobacter lapidis]|nr:DUF222 domain-containing protein [Modestobacter lapidis]